jgi:hypothetical protein
MRLEDWGMHEVDGVLVQDLENGTAMQVKLEADRVGVRHRAVPVARMNDVTAEEPEWLTAYNFSMAEWVNNNSPVWQWLQEKGIDAAAAQRRMMGLVPPQ